MIKWPDWRYECHREKLCTNWKRVPVYRFWLLALWPLPGREGGDQCGVRPQIITSNFLKAYSLCPMSPSEDVAETFSLQSWCWVQEKEPNVLGRSPFQSRTWTRERSRPARWMSPIRNRVREFEPLWRYQAVTRVIGPVANMQSPRSSSDDAEDTVFTAWPELR